MSGILAEKIGMTQIFIPDVGSVPVTVLQAGPCVVVMKNQVEKNGYNSIQIGFKEVESKKLNKPRAGHFTKKNLKSYRYLKEVKTSCPDQYTPGDVILVTDFEVGDTVDVSGVSKGRGFQGVMKRHQFAGGRDTHGCSLSHRVPGSIGQRTWPGRVIKGKKMPGHMGAEKVTVRNLKIVGVEPDQNLILVRGAVPGHNHSIVEIHARSDSFEKKFLERKNKSTGEPVATTSA